MIYFFYYNKSQEGNLTFSQKRIFLKSSVMKPYLRTRRTTRFIRYYHDIKKGHIGLGSAIAYQSEDYPTKEIDRERPLKASATWETFKFWRESQKWSPNPPPFPFATILWWCQLSPDWENGYSICFSFYGDISLFLSSFIWPVPLQSAPHFISLRSFPLKEEGETEKAIIPFFFSEKKKICGEFCLRP